MKNPLQVQEVAQVGLEKMETWFSHIAGGA